MVSPTCTEGGYTLHECSCGDSYTDTETAARGHFYPTSTATVCTRCGYIRELESSTVKAALSIVSEDDAASSTITRHHEYTYASGKLMREVITTTEGTTTTTQTLNFFYDSNGTPYAIKVDGTVYYYITNLQGDVMSIVDGAGAVVASYEYDPYGAIISATGDLAEINPLRYRGYYYDTDTRMYYLQSRYYDPATCRFINADSYVSTGQGIIGYNMFAYCGNNSINYCDPSGHMLAYDMFEESIIGDGDDQYYDEKSKLSKALAKSKSLREEFESNLARFIASGATEYGVYFGSISTYGGDTFADKDLALSVGAARYSMTIVRETRTTGFLWWKKEQTRYVATTQVSDTYDFTEWRKDFSFGSIMNNLAFIGQIGGTVKPYYWEATVVITTEWEDA